MRKWITFLMTLLVGSGVSYANAGMGQVEFEAGYRHDNISWRHRVPSCDPFIKESTRFHDLDIFQIGLSGRTTLGCNLYLRACGYWGWVLDGDFQESGTVYNNSFSSYSSCSSYSSSDFSSSCSSSSSGSNDFGCAREAFVFSNTDRTIIDDKYVYGVSGAVGYPFYFCDCTVIVAPIIGYAVDEQNIRVQHDGLHFKQGRGDMSGFVFPACGDECCRQTFISRWYGGLVGVDFCYRPFNECWSVYAEVEYHWGDFRGKRNIQGDRNNDDVFNKHNYRSREATGFVATVGADYDFSECWTAGLNVKFQDWEATRHHRRHCNDYEADFIGEGEHRERDNFKWNSYVVSLTVGRHF